ncbi:MAG: organomercurial lyase [Candidatus Rokuibacteriota bacterium]
MDYTRAEEMARKLTRNGGLLGYSPEQARLLLRVLRTLAQGRAVSGTDLDAFADDLGWARAEAHTFLRPLTERDAADRIVGVLGLSLAEHPHGFTVDGHRMSTWCAEDTLFLPALLGQTATVESASPLSRDPIRLTVGPEGVQAVTPPETVVSIALVDPDQAVFGSVEAMWMTFCHHIHFFKSREEAARWAAGREDLAILTPDEGYRIGRQLVSRFLAAAG